MREYFQPTRLSSIRVCVCVREISGQQAVSIDRKNIENNNSNSNNAVWIMRVW